MLTMFPPVAYLQVSESGQTKAPGMSVVSHLRHAAEQLELLEHPVDLTDMHARTASNTTLTRRVQDGRTAPLGVSHRINDGRKSLCNAFVGNSTLRDHVGRKALKHPIYTTNLPYFKQLIAQVVKVELPRLDSLGNTCCLCLRLGIVIPLQQPLDITITDNTCRMPLRHKVLEVLQVLSNSDIPDRFANRLFERQHGATLRGRIELRENRPGKRCNLVEALRKRNGFGSDHRIENNQSLVRMVQRSNRLQFIHEFGVEIVASLRVQELNIQRFLPGKTISTLNQIRQTPGMFAVELDPCIRRQFL